MTRNLTLHVMHKLRDAELIGSGMIYMVRQKGVKEEDHMLLIPKTTVRDNFRCKKRFNEAGSELLLHCIHISQHFR